MNMILLIYAKKLRDFIFIIYIHIFLMKRTCHCIFQVTKRIH